MKTKYLSPINLLLSLLESISILGLLLPGFPGQMPGGPGSDDIKQALSFYQAELNRQQQQQQQQQMQNKSDQLQEDKIW